MALEPRQRRGLAFLLLLLLLGVVIRFWPSDSTPPVVSASAGSVDLAEKRLARLREQAAAVPAREQSLKTVEAELATREKALIVADTAAQAQALLVQMLRKLAQSESPAIALGATELNSVRPFGDDYGEVDVAVQIECRIDQLVNLLAAIAAQPEMISTSDLRVVSSNAKDKTIGVRLTVAGIVPRRLVPVKRT